MNDKWSNYLSLKAHVPGLPGCLVHVLEWATGIRETRRVFQAADDGRPQCFFGNVVDKMGVSYDAGDLLEVLPPEGPVLVVANHPFGGTDALGLPALCAQKREDVLVMGNAVATAVPPLTEITVGVHIMEEGSAAQNLGAMRRCARHLKKGGVLVVFPAGAVSRWNPETARVEDPEWSSHVVDLARRAGAQILPVHFFGRNPAWFHLLSQVHPLLRAAFIPRVFVNSKGRTFQLRCGSLISSDRIDSGAEGVKALRTLVGEIAND